MSEEYGSYSGIGQSAAIDGRWWQRTDPQEAADTMIAMVRHLRNRQSYRARLDLYHAQLYANMAALGFGWNAFSRAAISNRISLNIVQSNCDTLAAKVLKVRPRAAFLPNVGDAEARERCESLERWCDGLFYETEFYKTASGSVLDTCVYGTGAMKVSEAFGKIVFDRVYPFEIVVNEVEARYGTPHRLYQRKFWDRYVLAETYKEHRDAIMAAEVGSDEEDVLQFDRDDTVEQVLVTEGWSLPPRPGGKGRHIIAIKGQVLLDEVWTQPYFPFVFVRRGVPQQGFWGIGIAETIAPIQLEVNYLLRNIQQAHHLIAKARVFLEKGSKVVKSHFTDEIGTMVEYVGTKPEINVPAAVPAEVYNHLLWLISQGEIRSGLSDLSTGARVPPGMDKASGKALRDLVSIETERHRVFAEQVEELPVRAALLAIDIAKGLKRYTVKWADSRFFEKVEFTRELGETEYVIQAYPTSQLSTTPAFRRQEVAEMREQNLIDEDEQFDLLNMPDLRKHARRRLAARNIIERNITSILRRGEFIPPENFDHHELALKLFREAYDEARLDKYPEEKLKMLQAYMAKTVLFLEEQAAASSAGGGPPGGGAPPPDAEDKKPPGPPGSDDGPPMAEAP